MPSPDSGHARQEARSPFTDASRRKDKVTLFENGKGFTPGVLGKGYTAVGHAEQHLVEDSDGVGGIGLPETSKLTILSIIAVMFTTLTGLLMGYDLCVIAVVLEPIQKAFRLCGGTFTCMRKELFVGMVAPGAMIGSLFGGYISDILGRRFTLSTSALSFVVGASLLAMAEGYVVLIFGRLALGGGVGIGFAVGSTYIAEIAAPELRGRMVMCLEFAQCCGCLLAYAIGGALTAGASAWRWLLGAAGIAAVIQLLAIVILPESPRWLVAKGEDEKARVVLRKLGVGGRKPEKEESRIEEQLEILKTAAGKTRPMSTAVSTVQALSPAGAQAHQSETGESRGSGAQLQGAVCRPERLSLRSRVSGLFALLREHRRSIYIAVSCAVCQNMTGATTILYYSQDIFRLGGVCSNGFVAGVGIGLAKTAGVGVAFLLVERLGRRSMLLAGNVGTTLSLLGFALLFSTNSSLGQECALDVGPVGSNSLDGGAVEDSENGTGASNHRFGIVAVMLLYMFAWNLSWAGLMFVVASEVLPTAVRGLGMGLVITTFWLCAFAAQISFETLFVILSEGGTFFLYCGLNVLSLFFVWRYLPETSGMTLEQIEKAMRQEAAEDDADKRDVRTTIYTIDSGEASAFVWGSTVDDDHTSPRSSNGESAKRSEKGVDGFHRNAEKRETRCAKQYKGSRGKGGKESDDALSLENQPSQRGNNGAISASSMSERGRPAAARELTSYKDRTSGQDISPLGDRPP